MTQEVVYLASGSQRRHALLMQIGVAHEIMPAPVDETRHPGEDPQDYVLRLALLKSAAACEVHRLGGAIVVGADTTVVLGGRFFGKPKDRSEGLAMLEDLSGATHQVFTGVAVRKGDWTDHALSISRVRMRKTTEQERANYWDNGEPRDKAGAYGVQGLGGIFVQCIEGSYSGVMGLPLCETAELLARAGLKIV